MGSYLCIYIDLIVVDNPLVVCNFFWFESLSVFYKPNFNLFLTLVSAQLNSWIADRKSVNDIQVKKGGYADCSYPCSVQISLDNLDY